MFDFGSHNNNTNENNNSNMRRKQQHWPYFGLFIKYFNIFFLLKTVTRMNRDRNSIANSRISSSKKMRLFTNINPLSREDMNT